MIFVFVNGGDVDQALKWCQRKMHREGVIKEFRRRQEHEKPARKRVRKKAELERRLRKSKASSLR